MLTDDQLKQFKRILTEEKERMVRQLKQNRHFQLEEGFYHEASGELSSYDNHPADAGTELFEREKDMSLNEHAEQELKKIGEALKAIGRGDYGRCKVCRRPIPLERLQALPATLFCKEHSPEQRISNQRPPEEPYIGLSLKISRDGGEALREVAKWGTSDTPSDWAEGREDGGYKNLDEDQEYVEAYENFIGNDSKGKKRAVYPNRRHEQYEMALDENGIMTVFGDLPPGEKSPYDEDEKEGKK